MRCFYCTCALALVLLAGADAAAQQAPVPGATAYTVFLAGQPIGREDVAVQAGADGTTVISEGRLSAPVNTIVRRAEFKYRPDWTPEAFLLDADIAGADVLLRTSFRDGTAVTEGTQAGKPFSVSHPVSPQAIIHATLVFGSYAALTRRLAATPPGTEIRLYVVPQGEMSVRVESSTDDRMQVGNTVFDVRRYELIAKNTSGDLPVSVTAAAQDGTLLRLSVPSQLLDVVRSDLASSTSRTEIFSNPGDEVVTIPAEGFNLGATLTRPQSAAATARLPVVVLLSGSNVPDREGFALGVPIMGQLAGTLSQAGFMVVRYDKRGYGQSGGRSESATIPDHAGDARSVLRWLERRKDVDPKRIALLGHGDGAWVALLAAARERKFAAVVTMAGPSSRGAELVLEQQQLALDLLQLTAEERERRIALQKQINNAVLTGKGWETVPPTLRKQADTLYFHSMLAYDPVRVLDDVRQPLLIVHGDLDRQIPVSHAERLANLAHKQSDSKSIELVLVKGVNHLFVPATTGQVGEYPTLKDRALSADATKTVTDWLARTFQAIR